MAHKPMKWDQKEPVKLTLDLNPGWLDGGFFFPFLKLQTSKRVISFAQEVFIKKQTDTEAN